jgi:hypothetical protein
MGYALRPGQIQMLPLPHPSCMYKGKSLNLLAFSFLNHAVGVTMEPIS